MTTSAYDASYYSSSYLGVTASTGSFIYVRDVSNPLDGTLDNAANLGTLTENDTQLSVKGEVSQQNTTHYYQFALDGDQLKLEFFNNTNSSDLRLQVMDSNGKVVADSSSFADTDLQKAFAYASSPLGLDLEAGTYYVAVSFDATAKKSQPQTYSLALYSGTSFRTAYQSSATAQTDYDQPLTVDNTMTYSLIDALAYSSNSVHRANETSDSAIGIGWLSADKSALSVTSQMTWVCKEQYYSFALQQGENLKMAFNNQTNTSDLRVQLYDSTGYVLYADNYGTDEQKAAYEALLSSDGLTADPGTYKIKVSYADGAAKTDQLYSFQLYSGTSYDSFYETTTSTETAATAILSGDLASNASARTVAATYLASTLKQSADDITSVLLEYSAYL